MEARIPDSAIAEDVRTITLPSGRIAAVREGKGCDLREVYRRLGLKKGKTHSGDFVFEMVVQLCRIDGVAIVAEDLDQMPLDDVLALQAAVNGGDDEDEKKTSSEEKASLSFSNTDSN